MAGRVVSLWLRIRSTAADHLKSKWKFVITLNSMILISDESNNQSLEFLRSATEYQEISTTTVNNFLLRLVATGPHNLNCI